VSPLVEFFATTGCIPEGISIRTHPIPLITGSLAVPRWLRLGLKSLLTASVLVALGVTVDPTTLVDSLNDAHWVWVGVALLLTPLNLILDGWVWKQLLTPVVDRVSLSSLAGAVLSGIALGFWTPARTGEYAGRALSLSRGDRWSISLTVFTQRMVDMAVGVTVGLLALSWAFMKGVLPLSSPWLAAATIGLGTSLSLTTLILVPTRVHRCVQWLLPKRTNITARTALFNRYSRDHGMRVIGGSIARYFVFATQLVCLGMAFNPSSSWVLLAAGAGLTFYAKYLIPSLTFLDLGIREGSAAFFFQQLGVGAAAGLNAALVLFVLNILVPALLGIPFLTRLHVPDISGKAETQVPVSPRQQ